MIRIVNETDTEALLEIYRYYVENTAITFEYNTPDIEEFRARIQKTLEKYPFFVSERGGVIEGYAYASPFKARAAYAWSVETTIYVRHGLQKQGVGKALYLALESALARMHITNLNACIGVPSGETSSCLTRNSAGFHEHLGYRLVGEFERCGYKFDEWLNMVWMEKLIGEHQNPPKPVLRFSDISGICRCAWANPKNERYVRYHDEEWGFPVHDDHRLFEMLILESFQAGLTWECVLNKQQAFEAAFDQFDLDKILTYDERKEDSLMDDPDIIRNRRKIHAAVRNARVFREIQVEYGSFDAYLWHWTGGQIIYENDRTTSGLSDDISKDLKKRGMTFVGSTIIYAYLQAVGVIYAHEPGCFLEKI